MPRFRLSIVLLCVVLPPLLYVSGMQLVEQYAENQIKAGLLKTYLGDGKQLFEGSATLRETARHNIDQYLERCRWLKWGGKATVTVKTKHNTLIYPFIPYENDSNTDRVRSPLEIASENYSLMQEELELTLVFNFRPNTLVPNAIIAVSIALSLGVMLAYYIRWNTQYQRESALRSAEIERLRMSEDDYNRQLNSLEGEIERMTMDICRMKNDLDKEKEQAESSAQEMLEEMIALEEDIAGKEAQYAQQKQTMAELQAKLHRLEQPRPKEKGARRKPIDMARKRLVTLYKNIDIHERAITGYMELSEDLKLKCEEMLVQINENATSVDVKRKVFGRKGQISVLEVVFGYKGRLYYIPKGESRSELLVVGTKNSQKKDLEYLGRQ